MILNDRQIKREMELGHLRVSDYDPALVNPTSLDFRLGNKYTFTEAVNYNYFDNKGKQICALLGSELGYKSVGCINPLNKDSFTTVTEELEEYWLLPQTSVLVSMYERLTLPDYISAEIKGKSSIARLGVSNSSEGGYIDASWDGVITLEISNHSPDAFLLSHKLKVGQLIFFRHDRVERGYNETGRYFQQEAGAGSKGVE